MTELLLLVKSQLDIKMTSYYNFKCMLLVLVYIMQTSSTLHYFLQDYFI